MRERSNRQRPKRMAVAGVLAVMATLTACNNDTPQGDADADAERPAEKVMTGTQPTVEQENQRPETSTGGEVPREPAQGSGG